MASYKTNTMNRKKHRRPSQADIQARYLTAPLGRNVVRGFIPHSVKAKDKPMDIANIYGVSYGTACVWIRILKGPQIARNGKPVIRREGA